MLSELDCDIYALQEVDNEPGDGEESMQLEYLSRELEMAAVPGLRIVRHTGEYGNAMLTRLPILSVHRHDLSYSWCEPRGALDVELDLGDSQAARHRDASGPASFRAALSVAAPDARRSRKRRRSCRRSCSAT